MAEDNRNSAATTGPFNEFEELVEELKTDRELKTKTGKLVAGYRKVKEAEAEEAASPNSGQLFCYRQS